MMINQLLFISQPPCHGKTSNKEVFFCLWYGLVHQAESGRNSCSGLGFFFCLAARVYGGYLFCQRFPKRINPNTFPIKKGFGFILLYWESLLIVI